MLNSRIKVRRIVYALGTEPALAEKMLGAAKRGNIACDAVPRKTMDSMLSGNHQGIAAEIESEKPQDLKKFLASLESEKKSFVCLLDEIQDPQNLGAIMRSAVCFGCSGIIIPNRRSAKLTGAVMKSSSGAFAYLPLIEVSNIGVAIERLKEKGFWVLGADVDAGEPLEKMKFDFPLALVLGNEHRGLKPVLKKSCDRLVTIPQNKKIASLNVSTAASIIFYEIHNEIQSIGGKNA